MADVPRPDPSQVVLSLRTAANNVEQHLAQATGLPRGHVAVILYLAVQQPATIPDVAAGVGRGYHWALDVLGDLRRGGQVLRSQSAPAKFALTDAGTELATQMNAAVWNTISSAHGWPAAVIAARVLDLLSDSAEEVPPIHVTAATSTSDPMVTARLIGAEPHVIHAWVRSGVLSPAPWTEQDLQTMNGLRGSVAAVWPDLLLGARGGQKFAHVANQLGLTTQKVASAIGRDPAMAAELDEALMEGRDPAILHGRRGAYRGGCWCPECRRTTRQRKK